MGQYPHRSPDSTQAAEEDSLSRLLQDYLPNPRLQRGQVVRGTVIRVDPEAVVVDVGAKCEGIVGSRELERIDRELVEGLKPGDKVMAYIINADEPRGEIVLSLVRARLELDWEGACALMEKKEAIELEPISANRGGLIVQLGRLRGFIPASQLSPSRCVPRISDPGCVQFLEQLIGQKIKARIIEADRERNRLILSERATETRMRDAERSRILDSLHEGEVRSGRVSNIAEFGAFVDIGGIDGLVHLSELSWERVNHPGEVLKIGQQIDVMVMSVDWERQRVALSLKRLCPDPWTTVAERYAEGQLVECCITRLTKWGAFAAIVGDEAIEGLIHVSELCDPPSDHPGEVVRPGQVFTLRVVRVEPERHRLALSLRRAMADGMGNIQPDYATLVES